MRAPMPIVLTALALAALGPACGDEEKPAPSCTDGIRNGAETGLDCGGSCGTCLDGQGCALDADCLGGHCVAGVCGEPAASCSDGKANGAETDVDCGGGACPGCAVGRACVEADDCASGRCTAGVCIAEVPPSCSDDERNGDETDVDCGGSCEPCLEGGRCVYDDDCRSNTCGERHACVPPSESCYDGRQNGEETGTDCGQGCPPCPDGSRCEANNDCQRGVCDAGFCDAPATGACIDGLRNGLETDVDCGGGECAACQAGFSCWVMSDCLPPLDCTNRLCGDDPCFDSAINGHETDVDCGGALCRKCGGDKLCASHQDCISGECAAGRCTEPPDLCGNQSVDGDELDVDCGGGLCPACPDGYRCHFDQDCTAGFCQDGVCGDGSCFDGALNGHETDFDCGGGVCAPCAAEQACLEDADCLSLSCTAFMCDRYAATCTNGQLDGWESDEDCGGPSCPPCGEGRRCTEHLDCESGGCVLAECGASVVALQTGAASVGCTAPGVTVVRSGVKLGGLLVSSPVFSIDQDHDGFYVQPPSVRGSGDPDTRNTGILVVTPRALSGNVQLFDEVALIGDYRENGCMSELFVSAQSGLVNGVSGQVCSWFPVAASLFENGGTALAEPYESVMVAVDSVQVTNAAGYSGPESAGNPRWSFMAGNGIYVADDFALGSLPEVNQVVDLRGFVKQRHGVYLIVPTALNVHP